MWLEEILVENDVKQLYQESFLQKVKVKEKVRQIQFEIIEYGIVALILVLVIEYAVLWMEPSSVKILLKLKMICSSYLLLQGPRVYNFLVISKLIGIPPTPIHLSWVIDSLYLM